MLEMFNKQNAHLNKTHLNNLVFASTIFLVYFSNHLYRIFDLGLFLDFVGV